MKTQTKTVVAAFGTACALLTIAAAPARAQIGSTGSVGPNGRGRATDAISRRAGEATGAFRETRFDLRVNGQLANADVAPTMKNGRASVPIRFVTEYLGGTADWNAKTRQVTLYQGVKTFTMTIGSTRAMDGSEGRALSVAPIIRAGRTMIPLKEVARFYNAAVQINPETRVVFVTTANGSTIKPTQKGANSPENNEAP